MKFLIFRFSALGDVALTVPVIASLAKQYPDDEFIVVSRPFVAPLFANLGANVVFRGVDLNTYKGAWGLMKLANKLRRETHAKAVADLHDVLRTQILRTLLWLMGMRVATIDKGRGEKRLLVSGSQFSPLRHVTMRYAEVFERLGRPVKMDFAGLELPPLSPKNIDSKWLGIAPFAAHRGKIYPLSQMRLAVETLLEKYPQIEIFVFGSRGEMNDLRPLWTMPRLHFVCDSANGLGDELRLMRQLDAMVSMDSANLHLASLVKTPVISLWGATHPYAGFTGYGQSEAHILQLDLPCRPCSIYGNKPCKYGDYHCLHDIPPQRIVTLAKELLFSGEKAVEAVSFNS